MELSGSHPKIPLQKKVWTGTRPYSRPKTQLRKGSLRSLVRWLIVGALLLWSLAALLLVALRWIDPPTTAVHMQRRFQSWIHHTPYQKRYKFIPLSQISPDLQHAVIAAEDARFYQHHGFDWHEIQIAAKEDLEGDRTRGASTLIAATGKKPVLRDGPLSPPQGEQSPRWYRWPNSSSASGAFWRST